MIQVEVAVFVELLALLSALAGLTVGRVKLIVKVYVFVGLAAADKICVLLQRMILVVTHISDRQDQTQP